MWMATGIAFDPPTLCANSVGDSTGYFGDIRNDVREVIVKLAESRIERLDY